MTTKIKIYHLMALAPARITIAGANYSVYGGQSLKMPASHYDQLMQGPYRSRFTKYGEEEADELPEAPTRADVDVEASLTPAESLMGVESTPEEDSSEEEAEPDYTGLVPLDVTATAQKVKAFVLDIEEQVPLNLEMVMGVRQRFSKYPSVVKECDRILGEAYGDA